jgi:hypothetical protein
VVAERRLNFPIGTSKEAIETEVDKYCEMYENDHKLAAEAEKRSKDEAEADKVLAELIPTK